MATLLRTNWAKQTGKTVIRECDVDALIERLGVLPADPTPAMRMAAKDFVHDYRMGQLDEDGKANANTNLFLILVGAKTPGREIPSSDKRDELKMKIESLATAAQRMEPSRPVRAGGR